MEIVVEDIEALEFDLIEEWDEQQKDWRFQKEDCKYDLFKLNPNRLCPSAGPGLVLPNESSLFL